MFLQPLHPNEELLVRRTDDGSQVIPTRTGNAYLNAAADGTLTPAQAHALREQVRRQMDATNATFPIPTP